MYRLYVIPAKAETQRIKQDKSSFEFQKFTVSILFSWIPAFAGMT